jgi:hypothetical protein
MKKYLKKVNENKSKCHSIHELFQMINNNNNENENEKNSNLNKFLTNSWNLDNSFFESKMNKYYLFTKKVNHINSVWFHSFETTCNKLNLIKDKNVCQRYLLKKNGNSSNKNNNDSKKKLCVFLHGAGEQVDAPPQKSFEGYWGDIQSYTPQCSDYWFVRRNTKKNGWDNIQLQKDYCNVALLGKSSTNGMIKDTVIFTHSMGNLILSAAIENGFCDIDLKTSSWYQAAAPFNGSRSSTFVQNICKAYYYDDSPLHFKSIYGYVATVANYCRQGTPDAYKSYVSCGLNYCCPYDPETHHKQCIKTLYPNYGDIYSKGRMCGTNALGLVSVYSPVLKIISYLSNYGSLGNDGFVSFESCGMKHESFNPDSYQNNFYNPGLNHADLTCKFLIIFFFLLISIFSLKDLPP